MVKFLDLLPMSNVLKHTDEKPSVLPWKVGFIFALVGMGVILTKLYSFSRIVEKRR